LARSFVLKNRQSDAVNLLQQIQDGEPPFGWSPELALRPPVYPVRELLQQLLTKEDGDDREILFPDSSFPLVEIKSKSKQNPSDINLNDTERAIFLRDGILFRERSIVVRRRKHYSLLEDLDRPPGIRRMRYAAPTYHSNGVAAQILAAFTQRPSLERNCKVHHDNLPRGH
jgi:hypothetical protein